jgi:hypothetical protein
LTPRELGDTEARQPNARRERDVAPNLLLKYLDAIFVTYVSRQIKRFKHASKTLKKHPKPS